MPRVLTAVLMSALALNALAHDPAKPADPRDAARLIEFPDTANYTTLVFDPHTHSSFSDGHVWPRIRVEEALRDGLDAIAITEHLEWQPHLQDVPHPNRNRAYDVAVSANADNPLLIVPGTEITRQDAVGHLNAVFIKDANTLLRDYTPNDPSASLAYYWSMHEFPAQDAVDRSAEQGAFVFWNHPWWASDLIDHIPTVPEFHAKNIADGKIHGIEVVNGAYYSEEAFQIALDNNLTLIGASDVHELIDWDYRPHEGGHRPVTLALAEERSLDGLHEALRSGNTLVWFKNTLIGREAQMQEMLAASLRIESARYEGKFNLLKLVIKNHTDMDFELMNAGDYTFSKNTDLVQVPQHAEVELVVKTPERLQAVALPFTVLNALTAPKQAARLTLQHDKVEIIK